MNTKTFAQLARKNLINGVRNKLRYWGFDGKTTPEEEPQTVSGGYIFRGQPFDDPTVPELWQSLRRAVKQKGLEAVAEEAAYTWFNRIMAIRILAKNGYDPAQLEFAEGAGRLPILLQRAQRGTYPFLNDTEKKRLQSVIGDYSRDTEAFAILLIGYCHSHTLLQTVFGNIDDYTELLLPDDILAEEGFLNLLNSSDAISDEAYKQVELIGWLYQFYISEKKDEVFASFKKNKKAEAEDIPAATQIFTPNWIVKYMVQNTVGKLWLDLHPDSPFKANMKYLVEGDNPGYGDPIISEVAQLKLLDPAAGSGHILVEGFDLLYDMYLAEYYPPEEAVESILRHNLFGLDIDKRATQLAQFALLLKAATRHRDILKKGLRPNIYAMPEPRPFSRQEVLDFLGKDGLNYVDKLFDALHLMQQAQNLGSIMQFNLPETAVEYIAKRWRHFQQASDLSFHEKALLPGLSAYLPVLLILCGKYEAVVANPPYMGQGNMNGALKDYVNAHYKLSKSDLFAVFMEVCLALNVKGGLMGMINQHSWMFLSTFEKLREHLLLNYLICNMLHLGPRVFEELSGEVVQSTAFVLSKSNKEASGTFYRLVAFKESGEKERQFAQRMQEFPNVSQSNFSKIPGSPIAYWASEKIIGIFKNEYGLNLYGEGVKGLDTGDDNSFLRQWWELSKKEISFADPKKDVKWFPYCKGGAFRKWYGNREFVVNWGENGNELLNFKSSDGKLRSRPQNIRYYFKEGLEWSRISSGSFGVRSLRGAIFGGACSAYFTKDPKHILFILGLLNSKNTQHFLQIINPTLVFQVGDIKRIPILKILAQIDLDEIVNTSITISKQDWDRLETSWDFQQFFLFNEGINIYDSYKTWISIIIESFFQLHANEEALNRLFIDIYDLQDELTPEVPLKDITILQEELNGKDLEALEQDFREKGKDAITLPIKRDVVMQQFISYLIGVCMGRYRLDKPGLYIAHPNPTAEEIKPYQHNGQVVEIDEDAILPLMGSACAFPDDALSRVKQLLDVIWGEDTRTDNLNFLQECLDSDLEKYLVKQFWKDHCKRYKKKPIYWLFSSPGGAFQVLVYMHRMNAFTVERIREKYLLPHLVHLRGKVQVMEGRVALLSSQEARQLDNLRKDIAECEGYELQLKTVADRQVVFDLDDGVTVNYGLFEGVVAIIK
ncbi:MAG: BREX-1 system adenine-specific DNA-methyltransferase PglX [Lewinellaceae bacterium]|nr:BREX-1 system adenine-specific DNA-methyltransferase PglX [Saprospiraceae bacterium]MCB9342818.1 BREX-1 system adenine-specific DNA-methyltransferase PglX [Lewinellaceae bacterium]